MNESIDDLIGYNPSPTPSYLNSSSQIEENESGKTANFNLSNTVEKGPQKTQQEVLMEVANESIDILFKDQYGEGHARILNNDHMEIVPINSSKFTKFLSKLYYENEGEIINKESINNAVYTLQAKAEFGDTTYSLSLRVAEYQCDFYYDLTDAKHRCIKISKDGTWQILDKTPIPLFRRYIQIQQDLPCSSVVKKDNKIDSKQLDDPLETFISKLTNIKDLGTKLLVKVSLLTYFIPSISHTRSLA